MENNIKFINIREILSRLLRHPLLQDLNLESAIQYTIDFVGIVGYPNLYYDKITDTPIEIKEYRGLLPCDLIQIKQVRDCNGGMAMRSMTDSFYNISSREGRYESTFKTQGDIIYTSFKEGNIDISYLAIPIDNDNIPLISDNPVFLRALEAFIKKEHFTILFDLGKISIQVLQNTQQEYAWRVKQCNSEFTIPSISEMESITRMWNQLIPKTIEFDKGFKTLGSREYIKVK